MAQSPITKLAQKKYNTNNANTRTPTQTTNKTINTNWIYALNSNMCQIMQPVTKIKPGTSVTSVQRPNLVTKYIYIIAYQNYKT
jgi:hypothetical protein